MLDGHIDDDLKNGRTIINPKLILDSIKGRAEEIMKRKSNLMRMFYENAQIYDTDEDLRYSWQPEDTEDKSLITKKLHKFERMS